MEIKMTKEMINTLNELALVDFDKAKAMLDGANLVLGTKYGWLARRVVWFENPDGGTAAMYAAAHDAWAWAD